MLILSEGKALLCLPYLLAPGLLFPGLSVFELVGFNEVRNWYQRQVLYPARKGPDRS